MSSSKDDGETDAVAPRFQHRRACSGAVERVSYMRDRAIGAGESPCEM
jgi:hypothetical protein